MPETMADNKNNAKTKREPGGNEDPRNFIIDAPGFQTLKQRYSSALLTLIFWVFWFYLWQPLISIIAWGLGIKFFYENMVLLGGIYGFLELALIYLLVVMGIGVLFFGWAFYNNRRFKKKKRRAKLWKISFGNLSNLFQIDENQVLALKSSRYAVVHFDENGHIKDLSH
jgi:biofilm PGA synthesis protein PgaD